MIVRRLRDTLCAYYIINACDRISFSGNERVKTMLREKRNRFLRGLEIGRARAVFRKGGGFWNFPRLSCRYYSDGGEPRPKTGDATFARRIPRREIILVRVKYFKFYRRRNIIYKRQYSVTQRRRRASSSSR